MHLYENDYKKKKNVTFLWLFSKVEMCLWFFVERKLLIVNKMLKPRAAKGEHVVSVKYCGTVGCAPRGEAEVLTKGCFRGAGICKKGWQF